MRAMLITAGLGTRLSPLTERLPKPAVPVANRPAGWFALDHLRRCGLRDFVLNTHHLPRELERELRAAAPPDVSLRFVYEPEILDTGGGIHNAWQPREGETFLAMSGKYVYAPDIAGALQLHQESGAFATMIIQPTREGDPLGAIAMAADGSVQSVPGGSRSDLTPVLRGMYTGVSLYDWRVHASLPERGHLIRDGFARWLERGERIMAFVDRGNLRDVGMSLAHYLEANLALATGVTTWPGIEPSAGGVVAAPSAQLAPGVTLRETVVGADAQIGAGVSLERCVVWPGARVERSLREAIVLSDGLVVPVQGFSYFPSTGTTAR